MRDTMVRLSPSRTMAAEADADASHTTQASTPLRIAMVAPPYFEVPPAAYGGIEAVIADLTDALVSAGHHVTLLAAGRPGTKANFLPVWEDCVAERLGDPTAEITFAAAVRDAVLRLAEAGQVDLVHDHTFAGPLNAAAYTAAGLPSVVTVHGPVTRELDLYYRQLGGDLRLISISRRQRELAADLSWLATVHNGLRPQDWPFTRGKGDYALFLGRFHHDKGAHVALEAAHEAGLPLLMAGKCSEPVEKDYFVNEVVPRLGPDDRVLGVADAKQKRDLLANARCLLFPILWEEPFGMVMIESMACGTPVVALRGGAVAEVIDPGITGIICEEPAELTEALDKITTLDPADCRAHVAEQFSADHMADGYVAAYRQAIAGFGRAMTAATVVTTTAATNRSGFRGHGERPHGRERRPLTSAPERRR